MGVQWEDCQKVARLLGTKTFINEFIAYERLSELIHNRKNCDGPSISVSDIMYINLDHFLSMLILFCFSTMCLPRKLTKR